LNGYAPKRNPVAQTIFAPLFTGTVRVSTILSSLLLLLLASQAGAQISGTVTHERNEVLPPLSVSSCGSSLGR